MFGGLGNFLGNVFHGAQNAVNNVIHPKPQPQQPNLGQFLAQHLGAPVNQAAQAVAHQAVRLPGQAQQFVHPFVDAGAGMLRSTAQIGAIPSNILRADVAKLTHNQAAFNSSNAQATQGLQNIKSILQAAPQTAVRLGESFPNPASYLQHGQQGNVNRALLGADRTFTPHPGWQQALVGDQPIQSYAAQYNTARKSGQSIPTAAGGVAVTTLNDILTGKATAEGLGQGLEAVKKVTPAIKVGYQANPVLANQAGSVKLPGKNVGGEPVKQFTPPSGDHLGFDHLNQNLEQLKQQYQQQHGTHLNTDDVRELFKPAGYDRRVNTPQFQEAASKLNDHMFNENVKNVKPGDNYLFTAGSSGAGKTAALKNYPGLTQDLAGSLDGNFSSAHSLDKVQKIIDQGGKPRVAFVNRTPVDAWMNGVVKRALNPADGRVLPLDVFVNNLADSPKIALEANKRFGNKVDLKVLDNTHGAGGAKLASNPVDYLSKLEYNKSDVKNELTKITNQAIQDGKIPADIGQRLLGERPSGQLEPQRLQPQKLAVQLGKNDKATALNLRDAYSGYKNSEIVAGNQLSDTIKKLAPKEQNAIFWFNEAGGNLDTLKSWATDGEPLTKAHIPDIQAAMKLSPEAQKAAGLLQEYYKAAGTKALDTGAIKTIRSDYNNARLYKPAPPGDFVSTGLSKDLKMSTTHSKQRVYNTMHEAILNGKEPATTNAADLMSIHNEELARVNASRNLAQSMADSGLGKMVKLGENPPPGYKAVLTNGGQVLTAPEHIAKGLRAISDPNFLNNYETFKGIKKYQGLTKTVDLSYSLFHHFTMAAQTLYQTAAHPIDTVKMMQQFNKDINPIEQDFVQHTGITSKVHQNMDVMHAINGDGKLRNLPVVKQFLDGTNKSSDILFGHMQRYLKVTDYGTKAANWLADHPTATNEEVVMAKRSIAKEVNAAYGGLNFESMGIDKTMQGALRTVLLAPDWTLSNLQLGKLAFEKSPGGSAARQHIATALIGGVLATEAMNKALTGHWTNQNEKGHEFEVQVQPGVYVSLLRGGIGDLIKVGSMISENGLATGSGRFLQGKFSPFLRTAIGLATGKNYNGQSITKKGDNFLQDTVSEGKFLAQSAAPIPFGASSSVNYATSGLPTNPVNAALLATGLARFSAPPKGSDNSAAPRAAKAGETPGGNIKTSIDKTATNKSAANARNFYGDVTLTKPIQDSANRVAGADKHLTPTTSAQDKKVLEQYARLTDQGKAIFKGSLENQKLLAQAQFDTGQRKTATVATPKVARAKTVKAPRVARTRVARAPKVAKPRAIKFAKMPSFKPPSAPKVARAKAIKLPKMASASHKKLKVVA